MKKLLLAFLCLAFTIDIVDACSAIVLKNQNQLFLAKNFDWTLADGMVIKNLRGTVKSAYHTHSGQQASWTSKYGSITFNQNGKEMPYGGMNEKGLAIEMLWLDVTRYNINEDKAYLNELEWIQYQLDQFETIQEVINHLDEIKIYPIKGKIHYILADHTGESVIIEYLNGKPLTYAMPPNTCQAITNNSVLQSAPFKQQANGIKKTNTASTYRYYQLEQRIAGIGQQDEINEELAFDVLRQVRIPKGRFRTMWSIVYDIAHRRVSFLPWSIKR